MSSRANIKTVSLVGVYALHFRTLVLIMVEATTHSAGTFAFRGTVLMCLHFLRFLAVNDFRVCCSDYLEVQTQLNSIRNLYKDLKEIQLGLHLQITGTANSKVVDSKKTQRVEAHQNCASDSKIICTMCGRFYDDKDKCPEVE